MTADIDYKSKSILSNLDNFNNNSQYIFTYTYYKMNASKNTFRLLKRKIKLLKCYEHCDLFSLRLNYYVQAK